jgi:hypothetical protein
MDHTAEDISNSDFMTGDGKDALEHTRARNRAEAERLAEAKRRYEDEQSSGSSPEDQIYAPIYRDGISSDEWFDHHCQEQADEYHMTQPDFDDE